LTRFNTLLLDQTAWDLIIDSAGNIAMAAPPYALAQDVASAVRLFLGELWYNTAKGIPYFEDVLGQLPPATLLTGYMEKAALTVPGVVSAQVIIASFDSREITGQVQFIDETGAANAVTF
jgi:predicted anti-sigma-YlaC factor YlaD